MRFLILNSGSGYICIFSKILSLSLLDLWRNTMPLLYEKFIILHLESLTGDPDVVQL